MAIIDSQKENDAGTSAPRFASTDPTIGTTIVTNPDDSDSILKKNSKYKYENPSSIPTYDPSRPSMAGTEVG